jgi:formylglycine-generating enzyme required for sulfatase activity
VSAKPSGSKSEKPATTAQRRERRPIWKDPIVVVGAAVPTLVLAIFFINLAWPNNRAPTKPNPTPAQEPPRSDKTVKSAAELVTNSIGMTMLLIPAGEFAMGSPLEDTDAEEWEMPQHHVRIAQPFYLSAHEVTRGQFRTFVRESGYSTAAETDGQGGWGFNEQLSKFQQHPRYTWRNAGFDQTDDHPVINITWNDAVAFANWLSHREGRRYRLPTEAEWEYACRAETTTIYSNGDDPESLAAVGNVNDAPREAFWNSLPRHEGLAKQVPRSKRFLILARDGFVFTAPVGHFQPNSFGLFDMHGNVAEWCSDWYQKGFYAKLRSSDPSGPTTAIYRVIRGGSWNYDYAFARSANRNGEKPDLRTDDLGFRLALDVGVQTQPVVRTKNGADAVDISELTPEEFVTSMIPRLESRERGTLIEALSKIAPGEKIEVMDIVVRPVAPDDRKVPWLWESTATAAITRRRGPDEAGQGPVRQVIHYRAHFQEVPRGRLTNFWWEFRSLPNGYARRRFELSEWTKDFRLNVSAAWIAALEKHNKGGSEREPVTGDQKDPSFAVILSGLAKSFEITDEEVKDILAQAYRESDKRRSLTGQQQTGRAVGDRQQ